MRYLFHNFNFYEKKADEVKIQNYEFQILPSGISKNKSQEKRILNRHLRNYCVTRLEKNEIRHNENLYEKKTQIINSFGRQRNLYYQINQLEEINLTENGEHAKTEMKFKTAFSEI